MTHLNILHSRMYSTTRIFKQLTKRLNTKPDKQTFEKFRTLEHLTFNIQD